MRCERMSTVPPSSCVDLSSGCVGKVRIEYPVPSNVRRRYVYEASDPCAILTSMREVISMCLLRISSMISRSRISHRPLILKDMVVSDDAAG